MANTSGDWLGWAQNQANINQVQMMAVSAAIDIASEALTNLKAARLAYATKVLNSPAAYSPILAFGVAVNQNVALATTSLTDATVKSSIAAIWNGYAQAM